MGQYKSACLLRILLISSLATDCDKGATQIMLLSARRYVFTGYS